MPRQLNKDPRFIAFQDERRRRWNLIATKSERGLRFSSYYHRWLSRIYRHSVMPGSAVLEVGCGRGDLLASLEPAFGVGLDFSHEMITRAKARHPSLHFIKSDAHEFPFDAKFEYVLLSDLINDVWDVQKVLEMVRAVSSPRTRIILNTYSKLWELPLATTRKLGLSKDVLDQNWLTVDDSRNLLTLTGFEVIRQWTEIILPLPIPILAQLSNRFLARIWPFRYLAMANFMLVRPQPDPPDDLDEPTVSVIVPARNEAGNIESAISRIPEMGQGSEIVFVEGHSSDGTYAEIEKAISRHPEREVSLFQQQGEGKGDAVRLGFSQAKGDILLILDADLTVPPEALPRFYQALLSRRAEFINGVRLVYPLEEKSMRFANLIGNKVFSILFSWIMAQPTKDTLCGTKGLWRVDYDRISANRSYFGDFDPFGDFDLLFGASRIGLKIVDMPVRYGERTYGETNIKRWRHGLLLIRMALFALLRLKFA